MKRLFGLSWIVYVLVLVIGLGFYWLDVRPSTIRRECEAYAGSKGGSKIRTNNLYRQCLVQHGMQPESLYVNLQ